MISYANGFSIATDKDNKHVLIRSTQDIPNFDEEDSTSRVELINILVDREVAMELLKKTEELLSDED